MAAPVNETVNFSPVARLEKAQKVLDLGRRCQLGCRSFPRLRHVELRPEKESIGALQLAHHLFVEPRSLEPHAVEPIELDRIADCLEERRHILRDAGTSANERVLPDPHELVHGDQSGKDGTVLDRHVSRELRAIRDDDAVTQVAYGAAAS